MRRRNVLLAILAATLAAAPTSPAIAQLVPLGPETQVNTAALHAFVGPVLAYDAGGGGELAVWTVLLRPDYSEVWARAFDLAGHPRGAERRIDTGSLVKHAPAVAARPGGGYAVVWINNQSPLATAGAVGGNGTVSLRLVGADGVPAGAETQIDSAGGVDDGTSLRIAATTAGFVVSWAELAPTGGYDLIARRFDAAGQPLGGEIAVGFEPVCPIADVALAGLADGGFAAIWNAGAGVSATASCPGFTARRFAADGRPAVPAFPVAAADLFAIRPDGSYLAVRNKPTPQQQPFDSGYDVYAQLYDANGVPQGAERRINSLLPHDQLATAAVAAVAAPNGGFLVVWSDDSAATDDTVDADVFARLLDSTGAPLAPEIVADSRTLGDQLAPQAAADGHGGWTLSWVSEAPGASGGDLFLRLFASCNGGACVAGRFRLDVAWRNPRDGSSGAGTAVALTADTTAFWFFAPANLELMVKVLDGRGVNGHFWVFYGALSDVEYTLTVTDTATGAQRTYHNPPYALASHADTQAF